MVVVEDKMDLILIEILSPDNYSNNFKAKEDFKSYLENANKDELNCVLEAYVKEEMYEQCSLIRDFINYKFN